jgi:hypothetical protein
MVSLARSTDVAMPYRSIAGSEAMAISATARNHSAALTASPTTVRMRIGGGGKPAPRKACCSRALMWVRLVEARS